MTKKAQFFLLAALIIVVIIIALATVNIGVKTSRENRRIFDLTKEIDLEGKSVVDFGVFTKESGSSTGQNLKELLEIYAEANPDSNITLVVGNESGYSVINNVEKKRGIIGIDTGGFSGANVVTTGAKVSEVSCPPAGCDTVQVDVGAEKPIEFNLAEEGQSFFIVISSEEKTGERTVVTNEPG